MASQIVNRSLVIKKIRAGGIEFSIEVHKFLNGVVDALINKGITKAKELGAKRIKPEHFE